jgi:hypothetical protein
MNTSKDFIDSINTKLDYDNFSEEVQINNTTSAGNMALYTVTNKNGVTFQKVPGQPGLENRGFMGFVNSDRARPIMLSGSVKIQESQSTDNAGTTGVDGIGGINNAGGTGQGMVDLTPSVAYDIELTASAGELGDDTETKTYFIIVG